MISFRSSRLSSLAPAHEILSEKDRFGQAKTFPYKSGIASAFRWRNTAKNCDSVTTSHLFWPNQRRKATSLLPIWLRNSDFLGRGYDQKAERGRGGFSGVHTARGLDP